MSDFISISTTISTTQKVELHVTEHVLLKLLKLPTGACNVKVAVEIPRGGDYSGLSLDLADCKLTVTYDVETQHVASTVKSID